MSDSPGEEDGTATVHEGERRSEPTVSVDTDQETSPHPSEPPRPRKRGDSVPPATLLSRPPPKPARRSSSEMQAVRPEEAASIEADAQVDDLMDSITVDESKPARSLQPTRIISVGGASSSPRPSQPPTVYPGSAPPPARLSSPPPPPPDPPETSEATAEAIARSRAQFTALEATASIGSHPVFERGDPMPADAASPATASPVDEPAVDEERVEAPPVGAAPAATVPPAVATPASGTPIPGTQVRSKRPPPRSTKVTEEKAPSPGAGSDDDDEEIEVTISSGEVGDSPKTEATDEPEEGRVSEPDVEDLGIPDEIPETELSPASEDEPDTPRAHDLPANATPVEEGTPDSPEIPVALDKAKKTPPPPPKKRRPPPPSERLVAAALESPRFETSKKPRIRPWWEELFTEDFGRSFTQLSESQVSRDADFIEESLGVARGGVILDLACGQGQHAVELACRGYGVVGFDLSVLQLAIAGEHAQDRGQKINFMQGDMREMAFDETFDGVFCWNTSFGYFEEEKNVAVAQNVFRALRPGGSFLLDVVNRDFVVEQQPSSVWFEGDACVCMDDMSVDFITSRMRVKRTMMLDDGRTKECAYSIRIYGLHELGKLLHDIGFRVTEASGHPSMPGVFFGVNSPRVIILAQKP